MIEQIKELVEQYANDNPYRLIFDLKRKYPDEFQKAHDMLKQEIIEDTNEELDTLKNKILKISDIVTFPYGTKFENIETGTIYIMEQQLKIIKPNGEYDYPAIDKESFEEGYRIVL